MMSLRSTTVGGLEWPDWKYSSARSSRLLAEASSLLAQAAHSFAYKPLRENGQQGI